jgi:hypothetical protein
MKVVVFTCDPYLELMRDFSYLFNKHWGAHQEVNVLGFKEPDFALPSNFNFISAGKQEEFPPRSFCQPFRHILEDMDTDVFTLMLDDMFLIDTLDQDLLDRGVSLLEENEASKIELMFGSHHAYYASSPFTSEFNVVPQWMNYRYTAAQHVVRKDYYLKYFDQPNIWALEVQNIPRSRNDGHNLLLPKRNPIVPYINVVVKGQGGHAHIKELRESESGRHFGSGWTKFQKLGDEEYEIFLKYENWRANV